MPTANHPRIPQNPESVCVIGTSARWLAESCRKAGFPVSAIDCFGDWDLRQCCNVQVIDQLSDSLTRIRSLPRAACLLFGSGYETLVVSQPKIQLNRDLANASPASVWKSCDVAYWSNRLDPKTVRVAAVAGNGTLLNDAMWLCKPDGGTGGVGVFLTARTLVPPLFVAQEFIEGKPIGVVAWSNGEQTRVLGAFEMLVGDPVLGAQSEFLYCGSVGPVVRSDQGTSELSQIVQELVSITGVRGLFGVDFIQTEQGFVPIEINPRPTASCELLERMNGASLLPLHFSAFQDDRPGIPSGSQHHESTGDVFGKAILYWNNPIPVTISDSAHRLLVRLHGDDRVADVSMPGSTVKPGQPVVTIFAKGDSAHQVRKELHRFARELKAELLSQCRVNAI